MSSLPSSLFSGTRVHWTSQQGVEGVNPNNSWARWEIRGSRSHSHSAVSKSIMSQGTREVFNTALWISLSFSFFFYTLWITTQSLSYSRQALEFALMCDLWQPLHIQWTKSDASYTEHSTGLGPQSVSRKSHTGTPASVLVLIRVYFLLGERRHAWSPHLCVRHQAGSWGPRDPQDGRLSPLGKASGCYLDPHMLMFFPSTASSTREMW